MSKLCQNNKMSEPRQHHYIPRFYLSGFVDQRILQRENREVIWVYERGKDPRPSSAANEARERDFYSYKDGDSRSVQFETWLSKLEETVAPIINHLKTKQRDITEVEKDWLALFAGIMQMRTPARRRLEKKRLEPFVTLVMKEAASTPGTFQKFIEENYDPAYMGDFDIKDAEQVEEFRRAILSGRQEQIQNDPRYGLFSMVAVGQKVGELLSTMNWQVIYCDGAERFLTSDDPVISFALDVTANRLHLREGVDRPNANVWLPLCREICIRMNKDCQSGYGHWVDAGIRYINKAVIMCADRWVYASERSDRVKTLLDKKGGKFSVDTVEFHFEGRKF